MWKRNKPSKPGSGEGSKTLSLDEFLGFMNQVTAAELIFIEVEQVTATVPAGATYRAPSSPLHKAPITPRDAGPVLREGDYAWNAQGELVRLSYTRAGNSGDPSTFNGFVAGDVVLTNTGELVTTPLDDNIILYRTGELLNNHPYTGQTAHAAAHLEGYPKREPAPVDSEPAE